MTNEFSWRDHVVTLDQRGRDTLRGAVALALNDLRGPEGPRSIASPIELHDAVTSLDVCPDEGVGLSQVLSELGDVVWRNVVVPSDAACVAHLHPPTLVPAVVTELSIAAVNQAFLQHFGQGDIPANTPLIGRCK